MFASFVKDIKRPVTKDICKNFIYDFNSVIEKNENKSRQKDPKSMAITPSSLNRTCLKYHYLRLKGIPEKQNKCASDIRNMEGGTAMHELYQTKYLPLLQEEGVIKILTIDDIEIPDTIEILKREELSGEVLLYDKKRNMRFKCDGFIEIENIVYILEIKTKANFDKFTCIHEPEKSHKIQTTAYSLSLDIDDAFFLYHGFGSPWREENVKAFLYKPSLNEKASLDKFIKSIHFYVKKDAEPPKANSCDIFCPYIYYCQS